MIFSKLKLKTLIKLILITCFLQSCSDSLDAEKETTNPLVQKLNSRTSSMDYNIIAENGMLVFHDLDDFKEVYKNLQNMHNEFLEEESYYETEEEDVEETDNLIEEYEHLAYFEKQYAYTSMRSHVNEEAFEYIKGAGREINTSPGYDVSDVIQATLFNSNGLLKIGGAYVYAKDYGKIYVVINDDFDALRELETLPQEELNYINVNKDISKNAFTNQQFINSGLSDIVCFFPGGINSGGSGSGSGSGGTSTCDPQANFTITPNPLGGQITVQVSNNVPGAQYNWSFTNSGTTNTASGPSAIHTFTTSGNQEITLTATINGDTYSCVKTTYVLSACDRRRATLATLGVNVNQVLGSPGQVQLSLPNLSNILLNSIDQITWNIGGQTLTGSSVNYTAPCLGTANGTVIISFNDNCLDYSYNFDVDVDSNECCPDEAFHTTNINHSSYTWRSYTHNNNTYAISYRHKQVPKYFFLQGTGTHICADIKHWKWNNNQSTFKKSKERLKISFSGNIYDKDNTNCECRVPRSINKSKTKNNRKTLSLTNNYEADVLRIKDTDTWNVTYSSRNKSFTCPIYICQ